MSTQKEETSDRAIITKLQGDVAGLNTNVAVIQNDVSTIKDTQKQMLGKMDGFAFTKQTDFAEYQKDALATFATVTTVQNVTKRIEDLEGDRTWLIRLVIAFVVLGILTAAIKFGR